jgi:hypothetical protein
MKSKILDCSDMSTVYKSLQDITGLCKNEIDKIITTTNFEEFYSIHTHITSHENVFLHILQSDYKLSLNYDFTYWFHASRIKSKKDFQKGLLPLNQIIDSIWDDLFVLQKDNCSLHDWLKFKQNVENNEINFHSADLYKLKINDSFHWGPYAFLIKEVIGHPDTMGNWDYLGAPEIVFDICASYKYLYNYDLLGIYLQNTKPAIIKFKHQDAQLIYIGIAFLYLYCKINKEYLFSSLSFSFPGRGHTILGKDIVDIEYVDCRS